VFDLAPPGPGQTAWTETVLLAFKKTGGVGPAGSLIADAAGNLYGTTLVGGESDLGTVFELSPPAPHKTAWTERVLLAFDGSSGENPASSLVPDSAGNLYGTTARGGAFGAGTVFELSPPVSGQSAWTETVLWSFDKSDGLQPMGNLIFDSSGSLYGTTSRGGAYQKCNRKLDRGTVFKLTPPGVGQTTWTESVLVSFNVKDGALPFGGLIADQRGHFYCTTAGVSTGKQINLGTVFKLTP
jgi:uncharacterized repeat protein (TIGR03803 family)